MLKRFFLLMIFSLTLFSCGFASDAKNEPKDISDTKSSYENRTFQLFSVPLYENDKWAFMANEFCCQRNSMNEKKLKILDDIYGSLLGGAIIGSLIATILSFVESNLPHSEVDLLLKSFADSSKFIGFLIGVFVSLIIYTLDNNKNIDLGSSFILKSFLSNWSRNKKITPEELHKFFDNLHVLYNKGGIAEGSSTTELVEQIKNLILKNNKNTEKCLN